MKTATRAQFMALLDKFGATVEENHGSIEYDFTVDAPNGFIWKGSDVHSRVYNRFHGSDYRIGHVYAEMIDDLKDGIERCTVKDCDVCGPLLRLVK